MMLRDRLLGKWFDSTFAGKHIFLDRQTDIVYLGCLLLQTLKIRIKKQCNRTILTIFIHLKLQFILP
jgi:hypothetical protein